MKIYTIGFTEKSAKDFFELLKTNNVKRLIDIRLNNKSQLSGFAKGEDLNYFCKSIINVEYIHEIRFAPTKELLDGYRKKEIAWDKYIVEYNRILDDRNLNKIIENDYKDILDDSCFLCSESKSNMCHRRLLVERISKMYPNIVISHL